MNGGDSANDSRSREYVIFSENITRYPAILPCRALSICNGREINFLHLSSSYNHIVQDVISLRKAQ